MSSAMPCTSSMRVAGEQLVQRNATDAPVGWNWRRRSLGVNHAYMGSHANKYFVQDFKAAEAT